MQKLTFVSLAEKVLKDATNPMSPAEIWRYAEKKGYVKQLQSNGSTPSATLAAVLYRMSSEKGSQFIRFVDNNKKMYSLKVAKQKAKATTKKGKITRSKKQETEVKAEQKIDVIAIVEQFAINQMNLTTKAITRDAKDKWVLPNVVGYTVSDGFMGMLAKMMGTPNVDVVSFHLVEGLNIDNLHESYFQAVSNSSWASVGYLVTTNFIDDVCKSILLNLSNSFNIGLIELNVNDVQSSKVLIPAKKNKLDLNVFQSLI